MRAITALSISLVGLGLLVFWQFNTVPNHEPTPGRQVPQGVPPSIDSDTIAPVATLPIRVSDPSEKTVPAAPESDKKAARERKGMVRLVDQKAFRVSCRVLVDGSPVAGGRVGGRQLRYDRAGNRDSIVAFGLLSEPSSPASRGDGTVVADVYLDANADDSALCGIAAFHPEFGTDFVELSVAEVLANPEVEFDLRRGELIEGRIVDEQGAGVLGAMVSISLAVPNGGISLEGIGVVSDSDGRFSLAGIRFGNVPHEARVTYFPQQPDHYTDPGRGSTILSPGRFELSRAIVSIKLSTMYDDSAAVWRLGEVRIRPWKPRDRRR